MAHLADHGSGATPSRRRSVRLRRFVAGLLASLVLVIAVGAAAMAAVLDLQEPPPTFAQTLGVARKKPRISNSLAGRAVVGMKDMVPGDRTSGTVRIGNRSKSRLRYSLGITRLVDTLGPNGGRLSMRLVLSVKRVYRNRRPKTLYIGALRTMPVLKLGTFKPREKRTYKIMVRFPESGPDVDNRFIGSGTSLQFTWKATNRR